MHLIKPNNIVLFILPLLLAMSSCKDDCNPEKQVQRDEATIINFLSEKNITAQRHSSGVYYQIINTGAGNITYNSNTTVSVKYSGRLLSGSVFDPGGPHPISFNLGGVIPGWQIGVPLIQKGGKIRLFIPSGLAYGCDGQGPISSNEVLDFDIELVDVTN